MRACGCSAPRSRVIDWEMRLRHAMTSSGATYPRNSVAHRTRIAS
jgi:hypothetical protein